MSEKQKLVQGYFSSLFGLKCPRCRQGDLFVNQNPYKKIKLSYMLDMHTHCPVCKQKYELETGFWYGTGYVSYALTVAISVASFIIWWIILGFSIHDNRIFYWLTTNGVLIVLLQPWLMRFSRALYLYFFVGYNENYATEETIKFT
jgi:hypothetical protein